MSSEVQPFQCPVDDESDSGPGPTVFALRRDNPIPQSSDVPLRPQATQISPMARSLSTTAMAERYQHVTDPIRRDVAGSRSGAGDRVAYLGGQPEKSPTKRTTIVVEGMQDPTRLRPGTPLSTKAEKARALRSMGQSIELMGEPEFISLLADDRNSGLRIDVADDRRFDEWMRGGLSATVR